MSREFSKPTQPGFQHLNGNILCVVDVETTGTQVGHHDIWQICVLPIGPDLRPIKTMPFYMDMEPRYPDHIDPKAIKLSRGDFAAKMKRAQDCWTVADYFDEWFQRLQLPPFKKICPLAHNWPFDREFVKEWLGEETYEQFFSPQYRDSLPAALFMNDCAAFKGDKVPYAKVNLAYLCNILKVKNEKAHDALQDCRATAEAYRNLILGSI